ncbi:MAG: cation transporter [Pseudomonadota bacterium]
MCHDDTAFQPKILHIALALNLAMFVVGMGAGLVAHSSALIADSLDMLADAAAYTIALVAQRRGSKFKVAAAQASGLVLSALGCAVLIDVARRAQSGEGADGTVMIVIACLSLVTNLYVLHKLGNLKAEGVHLRAAWIFTRADVVANICVILSGIFVGITGFGYADLMVGTGIAIYVLIEAREIFSEARAAAAH